MEQHEIRKAVREGYAKIALAQAPCCGPGKGAEAASPARAAARTIGYSDQEIAAAPEGANLGLGCGNPLAIAALREGDVVLDLGSGAGFDCFLSARKVGPAGRVIGVDMTPEMIEKARDNARKGGFENVEFRLGEIENLPVSDGSVDAVISNCVINLSPDKRRVFREAFRALRPGGTLAVSDIVLLQDLPGWVRNSIPAYVGCLAGAALKESYLAAIKDAGFIDVQVVEETPFPEEAMVSDAAAQRLLSLGLSRLVVSAKICAAKPGVPAAGQGNATMTHPEFCAECRGGSSVVGAAREPPVPASMRGVGAKH